MHSLLYICCILQINYELGVLGISIDEVSTPNAFAGDSVSVTIAGYDQQNMVVGYILSDPQQPVPVTSKFEARIVLFNITVPVTKGFSVSIENSSRYCLLTVTSWVINITNRTVLQAAHIFN